MTSPSAIKGLPPMDVPLHEQGDRPCSMCVRSFYNAGEENGRVERCDHTPLHRRCTFERGDESFCGPAGRFWKARNQ